MIWVALLAVLVPSAMVGLLIWVGHRRRWQVEAIHTLVDLGRSILALLFVPIVCAMLTAMVLLMWRGGWSDDTQAQRLDYFGVTLIILSLLIGLGIVWLQRREIPTIRIRGPGGLEANISEGGDAVELSSEADEEPRGHRGGGRYRHGSQISPGPEQ